MDFKEVYDANFAFVWRSLRRLRVPDASLKDAMQDVFLVVHRRLGEFEGRAKVSTWLFGICLRVAKDYRRRAHVRREVLDDSGFPSVA
ncbi:MAG TPA: sigma-70 family RNA polymerase sigma factor, partial [Polyangiaceae bacterium]